MSQTLTLKDSQFRVIGYVTISDNGDKILKDPSFRILGYYTASTDTTKDPSFRIVGYGDILTSLLPHY